MRRGLISWSRAEVPEAVLDARVAAVQDAMAAHDLDGIAVYTTPARAAAVAWLAGFVPYWNQGLLVVPRAGRPILVSALSNRVADWLQLNAHVAAVRNTPRIGADAAAFVASTHASGRIGIVDLAGLPATMVADLTSGGLLAVDAAPLIATARASADPTDVALHARAASIAHRAMMLARDHGGTAASLVAAIEQQARTDGAEEIYPALAVDLERSRALVRLEGDRPLADAYAVRISLAYKGAWVRLTRTFDRRHARSAAIARAAVHFAEAASALPDTARLAGSRSWLIEATRTTMPLEPVAGANIPDPVTIEPGQIVNVQATIDVDGCPVLLGAPVLTSRDGRPSGLLVQALH